MKNAPVYIGAHDLADIIRDELYGVFITVDAKAIKKLAKRIVERALKTAKPSSKK